MNNALLPVVVGAGVLMLIALVGLVMAGSGATAAERRLDQLEGRAPRGGRSRDPSSADLLKAPAIDFGRSSPWLFRLFSSEGLNRLYEQADVGIGFPVFLGIAGGLAAAGALVAFLLRVPPLSIPLAALLLGAMPFFWLTLRRGSRIKRFMVQMPDAMDLVGRALRAGHGLASGLNVVAEEMPPPISHEFGRVFEEQNLGIPIEDALRGLSERVPTMDVRFFVTAVIIQRSTGGDLAEVLDKIGRLIRERFQILGQVKALTGEGRISGAILLAMPPLLMAFVYTTNPDYISLLFTTEIGKKMLAVTAALQLIGAVAIKKIVTIKV
jgi:tight adherence protein B